MKPIGIVGLSLVGRATTARRTDVRGALLKEHLA